MLPPYVQDAHFWVWPAAGGKLLDVSGPYAVDIDKALVGRMTVSWEEHGVPWVCPNLQVSDTSVDEGPVGHLEESSGQALSLPWRRWPARLSNCKHHQFYYFAVFVGLGMSA